MRLCLKRIDPTLPLPQYMTAGSVAFDLYVRTTTVVQPGERAVIPLNLIVKVPEGYFLFLLPRSSMAKRNLFCPNSAGVIDQDYCGPEDELMFQVVNFSHEPVTVPRGDRLAQAFLLPIVQSELVEVTEHFTTASRGGIGSTGLK